MTLFRTGTKLTGYKFTPAQGVWLVERKLTRYIAILGFYFKLWTSAKALTEYQRIRSGHWASRPKEFRNRQAAVNFANMELAKTGSKKRYS